MKLNRSGAFPIATLAAAVLGLLVAAASSAFASAEDHVNDGLALSKSWVAQIDSGDYDNSYAEASNLMHDKIPQDHWSEILKAMRTLWGPLVSRQQLSHVYKPDGFEGAEGEFLVINYDTSFKNLGAAKEVVVLRWEDGRWRAAGYNASAKPDPNSTAASDSAGANSTTEVQTQEHVRPNPQ